MEGSSVFKIMVLAVFLCCCLTGGKPEFLDSEYLNIPTTEFVGSLKSTIGMVEQVMSIIREFSPQLDDLRLTNAISDCLDLMDLSKDQLNYTSSASQNPNGQDIGTGNVYSDMNTWLSGVLINQETCKEGLEGINSNVSTVITGAIDQVTSLASNTLGAIKPPPTNFSPKVVSNDWKVVQSINGMNADAVVSLDGTEAFRSVQSAIAAAPEFSSKRYVIYVKKGVYREQVVIKKNKWNIMLIGDGMDATVISYDRSVQDGLTTYRSATFGVSGRGFIARDITFENTAGPEKHQAVAFRSDSDKSVLYRCGFTGYQDTLYAHSQRQFYRECKIRGTVDFICGNGTVVFQNCSIQARKGLPGQQDVITAQSRNESRSNTGFSIQFCNITIEPDVPSSTGTYLGRPWKVYSRTVVMQSYIGAIRPEGWLKMNENDKLDTLYYGEYMNYGPGAGVGARVAWPGYHVLNSFEASRFTVAQFIDGNLWLPQTGIDYWGGL